MNTFISKHLQFIFTSLIQCIFMYFGRLLAKLIEVFLFSLMSTRHNSMVFWKRFQIMEEPFSLDQLACVRTCPPLATQLIILLCFSSTHLEIIYFIIFPYIFSSTYLIYHLSYVSPLHLPSVGVGQGCHLLHAQLHQGFGADAGAVVLEARGHKGINLGQRHHWVANVLRLVRSVAVK